MIPPPDPFEPAGPPDGFFVAAPTTMFLRGTPSQAGDRLADAILTARPGLLIVCLTD
jgi:hypothetical protein